MPATAPMADTTTTMRKAHVAMGPCGSVFMAKMSATTAAAVNPASAAFTRGIRKGQKPQ